MGALGSIVIENQINKNSTDRIETIEFNDTSTLTLTSIATPVTYGTDGSDILEGVFSGTSTANDEIYDLAGDDLILRVCGKQHYRRGRR